MNKTIAAIGLLVLLISAGCASGPDRVAILEQHVMDAENRIALLDAELQKEREIVEEDEQSLRARFAKMRVELDGLTDDVQLITGRLDEIEFMLKEELAAQEKKSERVKEDINENTHRVVRLEEYLNLEPFEKQKAGTEETAEDIPPVQELTEEQLYVQAKQAFDQQNMEGAREEFEKLIQRYPKSENADNAQFWIGEIYYREKWYEKAILEYQKVIENYPKGNKVQAALLKQGLAFFNLKDTANARLILNELVKKYPESSEADIARTKLKEF